MGLKRAPFLHSRPGFEEKGYSFLQKSGSPATWGVPLSDPLTISPPPQSMGLQTKQFEKWPNAHVKFSLKKQGTLNFLCHQSELFRVFLAVRFFSPFNVLISTLIIPFNSPRARTGALRAVSLHSSSWVSTPLWIPPEECVHRHSIQKGCPHRWSWWPCNRCLCPATSSCCLSLYWVFHHSATCNKQTWHKAHFKATSSCCLSLYWVFHHSAICNKQMWHKAHFNSEESLEF